VCSGNIPPAFRKYVFHASGCFLLGLLFDPEGRSDTFLRNIGKLLHNYTALKPRKSSELLGFRNLSIVRHLKNRITQLFKNWICFRPQVRGETPTLWGSLVRDSFWNTGRWTKSETPVNLNAMHYRQNPLKSTRNMYTSLGSKSNIAIRGSISSKHEGGREKT
jgi:hypothetical protein